MILGLIMIVSFLRVRPAVASSCSWYQLVPCTNFDVASDRWLQRNSGLGHASPTIVVPVGTTVSVVPQKQRGTATLSLGAETRTKPARPSAKSSAERLIATFGKSK